MLPRLRKLLELTCGCWPAAGRQLTDAGLDAVERELVSESAHPDSSASPDDAALGRPSQRRLNDGCHGRRRGKHCRPQRASAGVGRRGRSAQLALSGRLARAQRRRFDGCTGATLRRVARLFRGTPRVLFAHGARATRIRNVHRADDLEPALHELVSRNRGGFVRGAGRPGRCTHAACCWPKTESFHHGLVVLSGGSSIRSIQAATNGRRDRRTGTKHQRKRGPWPARPVHASANRGWLPWPLLAGLRHRPPPSRKLRPTRYAPPRRITPGHRGGRGRGVTQCHLRAQVPDPTPTHSKPTAAAAPRQPATGWLALIDHLADPTIRRPIRDRARGSGRAAAAASYGRVPRGRTIPPPDGRGQTGGIFAPAGGAACQKRRRPREWYAEEPDLQTHLHAARLRPAQPQTTKVRAPSSIAAAKTSLFGPRAADGPSFNTQARVSTRSPSARAAVDRAQKRT
jgi:hypothetical protein